MLELVKSYAVCGNQCSGNKCNSRHYIIDFNIVTVVFGRHIFQQTCIMCGAKWGHYKEEEEVEILTTDEKLINFIKELM